MAVQRIEALIEKGFGFHGKGRRKEAEAIYRKVLEEVPENGDALHLLGLIRLEAGRTDEAVELIKRSIRAVPGRDHVYNNLGLALGNAGKYKEAMESFRQALRINPENSDAMNNLGNLLNSGGEFEAAVELYGRALSIDGRNSVTLGNLGAAYISMNMPEKAVALLERALAGSPDRGDLHHNLGNALKSVGRFEEARSAYTRSLGIDPSNAVTLKNLGDLLNTMGKSAEAVEAFGEALEIDPNLPGARHLFDSLSGITSEHPPAAYVKELFDQYAPTFDHHLETELAYRVPGLLMEKLSSLFDAAPVFFNVIDLGCGSGLSGRSLKSFSKFLTGVDLSPGMLKVASKKRLYDRLIESDVVEYLSGTDEKFDLFFATDTFIYVGSLAPVFSAIKSSAAEGALLAFSTEKCSGEGFVLRPTGRYAHSTDYIRELASLSDFSIELIEPSDIRRQKGGWIGGELFVLRAR